MYKSLDLLATVIIENIRRSKPGMSKSKIVSFYLDEDAVRRLDCIRGPLSRSRAVSLLLKSREVGCAFSKND